MKRAQKSSFAVAAAVVALALGCGKKPPLIQTFTSDQASIAPGGAATLSWQVTDADSLAIDNGPGDVTGKSNIQVTPAQTTIYTLTAKSSGGTATATTTVSVSSATLSNFIATPSQVGPGDPVTLGFVANGATALTLSANPPPTPPDALPALQPTDVSAVVHPSATTTYTLKATGVGTPQPSPLTVLVRVGPKPVVVLSTAATAALALGTSTTLSWTAQYASDFTLVATPTAGGTAAATHLGMVLTTRVRPLVNTTYAIRAVGPSGTKDSNSIALTVTGSPATTFAFTLQPPPGANDAVRLQLNNAASTASLAVLDVVAAKLITANALALDLPLDGPTAGTRDGSARVSLAPLNTAPASGFVAIGPGLDVNPGALNPGTTPYAAAAALPTSGPLAGVLTVGIAQKPCASGPACAGGVPGDATIGLGTVIAQIRLALHGEGGQGPVFDAAHLDAAQFRSLVRNAAGQSQGTIAVGALSTGP